MTTSKSPTITKIAKLLKANGLSEAIYGTICRSQKLTKSQMAVCIKNDILNADRKLTPKGRKLFELIAKYICDFYQTQTKSVSIKRLVG